MNLRDYLYVIRRNWVLLIALALVGAAAGAGIAALQTPRYVATTTVLITTTADAPSELASANAISQQVARSLAAVIPTDLVLDPVIAELGLDVTAAALGTKVSAVVQANTAIVAIRAEASEGEESARIAQAIAVSALTVVGELVPVNPDAGESPTIAVVAGSAEVPGSAASPNVAAFVTIGTLAGLLAAAAISFGRFTLDPRVRRLADLRAVTDAAVLGILPMERRHEMTPPAAGSDSMRSEAVRQLRTHVNAFRAEGSSLRVVVTSTSRGEGTTTTALHLAAALSDIGQRVVLVESDLRQPLLAAILGVDNEPGLAEIVDAGVPVEPSLRGWREGLSVVPAGRTPQAPSESLASRRMVDTLHALEQMFDVIVIDAPALENSTDALVLSRLSSLVIVVVAEGTTRSRTLASGIARLHLAGSPALGIVVNKAAPHSTS